MGCVEMLLEGAYSGAVSLALTKGVASAAALPSADLLTALLACRLSAPDGSTSVFIATKG